MLIHSSTALALLALSITQVYAVHPQTIKNGLSALRRLDYTNVVSHGLLWAQARMYQL